jgi:hypothetical protein
VEEEAALSKERPKAHQLLFFIKERVIYQG